MQLGNALIKKPETLSAFPAEYEDVLSVLTLVLAMACVPDTPYQQASLTDH